MKIKYAIIAATILVAATVTSVRAFKESTPLFEVNMEVLAEGENGGYSCTVTSNCYSIFGSNEGSVSCTGSQCERGYGWVECDGHRTNC